MTHKDLSSALAGLNARLGKSFVGHAHALSRHSGSSAIPTILVATQSKNRFTRNHLSQLHLEWPEGMLGPQGRVPGSYVPHHWRATQDGHNGEPPPGSTVEGALQAFGDYHEATKPEASPRECLPSTTVSGQHEAKTNRGKKNQSPRHAPTTVEWRFNDGEAVKGGAQSYATNLPLSSFSFSAHTLPVRA